MKTLGLVMLALNEEEFIADALEGVLPFVDEAIVIDQSSTDKTREIAIKMGAQVIEAPGNFSTRGEKWFRDLAVRVCDCDWMMVIDADEVMSDGWSPVIREAINRDTHGAIEVPFYHLIGSYEYHSLDSPLWRPAFVRRHEHLAGSGPMKGPFAHSNYHQSYSPNEVMRVDGVSIFHLGYVQRDLMKRWRTNIRRGDYGYSKSEEDENLKMLQGNPCIGLPKCIPMTIDLGKYPEILRPRVGRTYAVVYDPESMHIRNRVRLS